MEKSVGGVRLVLGMVAVMWVLEVADLLTRNSLDGFGIQPRDLGGLIGVLFAPFLHFGFGHLLANTIPLVVLGAIIAFEGTARVLAVTAITALTSGAGIWLLGPPSSITAGASGIVFGYAAYLIARGVISRKLLHLAVGVGVLVVWGTVLLTGVLPQAGVSWQGHLFGAVGGVVAARVLQQRDHHAAATAPRATGA